MYVYRVCLRTTVAPAGKYYFFIFSFDTDGVDNNSRILPVVISVSSGKRNERLSEEFLRLVQTSGLPEYINGSQYKEEKLFKMRYTAYQHMANIRDQMTDELEQSNEAILNARLAGIEQSYQAKRKHIKEILNKVTNASIRRMREAQLKNLKAKKDAKVKEIEKGRQLHVNFTQLMCGFLDVVKSSPDVTKSDIS